MCTNVHGAGPNRASAVQTQSVLAFRLAGLSSAFVPQMRCPLFFCFCSFIHLSVRAVSREPVTCVVSIVCMAPANKCFATIDQASHRVCNHFVSNITLYDDLYEVFAIKFMSCGTCIGSFKMARIRPSVKECNSKPI